jgi:hypothetical protein
VHYILDLARYKLKIYFIDEKIINENYFIYIIVLDTALLSES